MTKSDKIILGSTAIMVVSTITMLSISNRYAKAAEDVITNIRDVHYILTKSNEDIIAGNKELAEGNKILRAIVKKSGEDFINTK